MGWLIALAVLILLAMLPLGVSAVYNAQGPLVRLIIGPVRIVLFPKKKKKPKEGKKKQEAAKASPPENHSDLEKESGVKENIDPGIGEQHPEEPVHKGAEQKKTTPKEPAKTGGSFQDFMPLVSLALDFLGELRRKIRVKRLEMNLTMAGGDPCDLAVNYGKAWAALGNLMPQLERLFVIKKRDLQVNCDFTGDTTSIYGRLDITITLGRLLGLGVRYAVKAYSRYQKIMKLRKGGAVK